MNLTNAFRIGRFHPTSQPVGAESPAHVGIFVDEAVVDLGAAGHASLTALLERDDLPALLRELSARPDLPRYSQGAVRWLTPVERQEVWAVGVTYLRSKAARMEESEFSATAYDRVYEAERPELFFKSMPEKVVHPGEAVGIRADSRWSVPEPEFVFFLNARGALAGFSVGNDMSARDI